jgi:hypothetical protein
MAAYTAIDDAGSFFSLKLWTGNSTSDRAMTGVGFQPDFLWIKGRNEGTDHELQDSVRGSTKYLNSNDNGAEATETEGVKSFDADGYTLGDANYWNWTAKTFVGWSWKAGTTSGITTNGSTTITPSSYSFNQTSGFSILAYTGNITSGAKLAHGLGVAPDMVICKGLANADSWTVGHKYTDPTAPWDYALILNTTAIKDNSDSYWNDTAPDTVNVTLGNGDNTNRAATLVAYCFASKQGFSKFGTYEGNGNANGAFVYTGFRPAFVITKSASASANSWYMMDRLRTVAYNPQDGRLEADGSGVEQSTPDMDLCANGFKLRASDGGFNTSGTMYVYMAFAESPLVNSEGVPGNARI